MRWVLDFNIQQKLNALMVGTLVVSSIGIVTSVTDLFTSDFEGLLRRSALDSAAVISGRVRSEIKRIAERAEILAATSLEEYKYEEDRLRFIEANLAKDSEYAGLSVYRRESAGFTRSWQFVHPSYEKLGWNGFEELQKEFSVNLAEVSQGKIDFRLAQLGDGTPIVRMAMPFVRERDGSFSRILVIDVRQEKLNSIFEDTTGLAAFLVDASRKILASTLPGTEASLPDISGYRSRGLASQFEFKDAKSVRQIAAVQNVGFADLSVVTQIPYSQIENTQMDLYRRSALLTMIFIFAAILLSLQSSETISRPIRALSAAADRVASGDFSVRVVYPGKSQRKNEVAILARSFNSMAGKIEDLMRETAAKARMEKELETAKLVQSRFLPNEGFVHPNVKLFGKVIPASECGGDWWQYAHVSDYLILVIGDVTGHGASSALITAAANSAFSLFLKEARSSGLSEPEAILRKLVDQINTGTHSATAGQASMTLVASVIDLETGKVMSLNASHPAPLVYREGPREEIEIQNLALPEVLPLGDDHELRIKFSRFELQPGDMILWYTDGLPESVESSQSGMRKHLLFEKIGKYHKRSGSDPRRICMQIQSEVLGILGIFGTAEAENIFLQQDDITLAVATIPQNARFRNLK